MDFIDAQGWLNNDPDQIERVVKNHKAQPGLDLGKINNIIQGTGIRALVYHTMFCPNVESVSGAEHDLSCELCQQTGFVDVHPKETRALIQSQTSSKKFASEGEYLQGGAMATFPSDIRLQFFTKVELPDITTQFYQRVLRSGTNSDILQYRAIEVLAVVGRSGKEYVQDIDFVLDANGSLNWRPTRGPDPGDIYSISYTTTMQYRAVRAIHQVRALSVKVGKDAMQTLRYPECWMLQQEFLVRRQNHENLPIQPNDQY